MLVRYLTSVVILLFLFALFFVLVLPTMLLTVNAKRLSKYIQYVMYSVFCRYTDNESVRSLRLDIDQVL